MGRVGRLVLVGALVVLFVPGAPSVAGFGTCTIDGSAGIDFLHGTRGSDAICAHRQRDYVTGLAGSDRLRGGPGPDTMVGGSGVDNIRGGPGDDRLFGVDGHGGDVLFGFSGFDRCYGEKHDTYIGCERVFTNHSPEYPAAVAFALSGAFSSAVVDTDAPRDPPCGPDFHGCGGG